MSRALRYASPNRLEWHEVAPPTIRDRRDAIVRPVASTTCDLDVRIIRGLTSFQGPFDIGHECLVRSTMLSYAYRPQVCASSKAGMRERNCR